MDCVVLCRTFRSASEQGQGPPPIAPYCFGSGPGTGHSQSDAAIKLGSYSTFQVSKHKEYLDSVCQDFFQRISLMINQGGTKQSNLYTEMTSEILQHFHLGRGRCEVFEGRDDVISEAKTYLENDSMVEYRFFPILDNSNMF